MPAALTASAVPASFVRFPILATALCACVTALCARVTALCACVTALCAACASAPSSSAPETAAALDLGGSALVVHSGGLDAFLTDPRDAGLRRALGMLDERLAELAEDVGQSAPPGSIELVCEALTAPWTLRVGLDGEGPVPVRATWIVHAGSAERAAALHGRLAGLIALFGFPDMSADDWPGVTEVETPHGSLFHGTTDEGRALLVAWGTPDGRAWDGAGALPSGVRTSYAFGIDLGAIAAMVRRYLPEGDEEAEQVRRILTYTGLGGDTPVQITVVGGHGDERAHSAMRYGGWATLAASTGALADGPLPGAALELVPDDATVVSLGRMEPTALLRYMEFLGPRADQVRAQVEAQLGIQLGADLLVPLGATLGLYLSDGTGGGGLTSAVAFVAVDDEAVMARTLATLMAQLHEVSLAKAEGRVRVRDFEHGEVRGYELDFPGLPVPLSPSLALAEGHLFVAATPQALAAALDAARARKHGRAGWRGQVAAARLGSLEDLQSLFYFDAPRYARAGYGSASALGAGLANAMRSATDAGRDPGRVWPTFAELMAGAQPVVSLARVQDGDLVTRTSHDRSLALHAAALLGLAPELLPAVILAGGLASLAAPSVTESLQHATRMKAQADVWQIMTALDTYAVDNQGLYPDSLEALLGPGSDGTPWLSELPLDPWGNAYVYLLGEEGAQVLSYGSDGVPGGEDDACDVTSDESWGSDEYEDEDDWENEDEGAKDED